MEDHRAHERIDSLEKVMSEHIGRHSELVKSIQENTAMTKTISENTAELVVLVKGVKGIRSFVLWLAPFMAAVWAGWTWLKGGT